MIGGDGVHYFLLLGVGWRVRQPAVIFVAWHYRSFFDVIVVGVVVVEIVSRLPLLRLLLILLMLLLSLLAHALFHHLLTHCGIILALRCLVLLLLLLDHELRDGDSYSSLLLLSTTHAVVVGGVLGDSFVGVARGRGALLSIVTLLTIGWTLLFDLLLFAATTLFELVFLFSTTPTLSNFLFILLLSAGSLPTGRTLLLLVLRRSRFLITAALLAAIGFILGAARPMLLLLGRGGNYYLCGGIVHGHVVTARRHIRLLELF